MPSRKDCPNLTEDEIDRVLDLVKRGVPPTVAIVKIGRAKSTVSMREDRDSEFAARLAQAEAEAQAMLLGCVVDAAPKDWRAATWICARRWPELYGDKPEVDADETAAAEREAADRAAWQLAVGTVPGFAAAPPAPVPPATDAAPVDPPASPG